VWPNVVDLSSVNFHSARATKNCFDLLLLRFVTLSPTPTIAWRVGPDLGFDCAILNLWIGSPGRASTCYLLDHGLCIFIMLVELSVHFFLFSSECVSHTLICLNFYRNNRCETYASFCYLSVMRVCEFGRVRSRGPQFSIEVEDGSRRALH
jgi:hypothetical protein